MTEECLERIKKHNTNINKLEEKLIKEKRKLRKLEGDVFSKELSHINNGLVKYIIKVICDESGFTYNELFSSRLGIYSVPKFTIYYLLTKYRKYIPHPINSKHAIGTKNLAIFLGVKERSTITHGKIKLIGWYEHDKSIKAFVDSCEREVKEYINKTKLNEKLCDW